MNSSAAERARAGINRRGHLVSFRRMTTTLPQTFVARADVRAIVTGYSPAELVNGITSGSRRVVVSLVDLAGANFPLPLKKGDRIYLGAALDVATTIATIDEDRRKYQGCADISTNGA